MGGNASTRRGYAPKFVGELLDLLCATIPLRSSCMLLGLSALQGSGKSTLAAQLARASSDRGIAATTLSLDDFYLGRRDRLNLARRVHPLLQTRGVPGTHDILLLESVIGALSTKPGWSPLRVPRFDKGQDTRLPPSRWRWIRQPPRLVILEGWCVGLEAEDEQALIKPVNSLERDEDADGHWRQWVNRQLLGDYSRLWKRLDRLLVLQAPAFEVVHNWRDEQEQILRARAASHAMSGAEIARFIARFERLSRHALASLPGKADVLVRLDSRREVRSISQPARPAA